MGPGLRGGRRWWSRSALAAIAVTVAACGAPPTSSRTGTVAYEAPAYEAPTVVAAPAIEPRPPGPLSAAVEHHPVEAATFYCQIPSVSLCHEYSADQIEVELARRICEGFAGQFDAGRCPFEGQIGYCTDESVRTYAYRPLDVALARTLLCVGSKWTDLDPMGLP